MLPFPLCAITFFIHSLNPVFMSLVVEKKEPINIVSTIVQSRTWPFSEIYAYYPWQSTNNLLFSYMSYPVDTPSIHRRFGLPTSLFSIRCTSHYNCHSFTIINTWIWSVHFNLVIFTYLIIFDVL